MTIDWTRAAGVRWCVCALVCSALGCASHGGSQAQGEGGTLGGGGQAAASGGDGGSGGHGSGGNSSGGGGMLDGPSGPSGGAGGVSSNNTHADAGSGGSGGSVASDAGGMAGDAGTMHARGGSAAAHVCAPGASYGDPFAGIGAVMSTHAPSGAFVFLEGPVWIASRATLFFSDNAASPSEQIWKLVPPSTTPESFSAMSGSNGLAVDNDDQLVVCNQGQRTITRVDPASGAETTIATGYMGKAFNSPNDAVVHSNGTIYFTDPPHGLKNRMAEIGFNGIFRITPDGTVTLIENWMNRDPNGVVLSPDERTLFVSEDNTGKVWKIALDAGGVPQGTSVLFTATSDSPDGMAVDCAGNLYVATAAGIEVFDPSGTTKLGTVPQAGSNCTFGGSDRKTLFITRNDTLYWVQLAVPGLPD